MAQLFPGNRRNGKKPNGISPILCLFIAFSVLVVLGVIATLAMVPNENRYGPLQSKQSLKMQLSEQVRESLPSLDGQAPRWNDKFWTPIDIEVSQDPMVIMCQLDFETYSQTPHKFAMFRDLVTLSQCTGKNRRRERMSKLISEVQSDRRLKVLTPTAFVFHESRVGSTLVGWCFGYYIICHLYLTHICIP